MRFPLRDVNIATLAITGAEIRHFVQDDDFFVA